MLTPRSHPETKGPSSLSHLQPPGGLWRAPHSASGWMRAQGTGHGGVPALPERGLCHFCSYSIGRKSVVWKARWEMALLCDPEEGEVICEHIASICHTMWGRELLAPISKIYFLFPSVFRSRLGQFTFHQPWVQDLLPPSCHPPPTFPWVPT